MKYYIHGADGIRYGPVDALTLQQYAFEGRIDGSTPIEEEATGLTVLASSLPVLGLSDGRSYDKAPSLLFQPQAKQSGSWVLWVVFVLLVVLSLGTRLPIVVAAIPMIAGFVLALKRRSWTSVTVVAVVVLILAVLALYLLPR